LQSTLKTLVFKTEKSPHPLLLSLFESYTPLLSRMINNLHYQNQANELYDVHIKNCSSTNAMLSTKLEDLPLSRAKATINQAISFLLNQKDSLRERYDTEYKQMSWWGKLTSDTPNYDDVNYKIAHAKKLQQDFNRKHSDELSTITNDFSEAHEVCINRLKTAYMNSTYMIDQHFIDLNSISNFSFDSKKTLQYGMWGGILGMSASVAIDLQDAGNIYDALRSVNGNFSEMTNSEIWWECLWMDADKLAGLTNLTKGAYFEQLVADETGGELFEHFNHKDTDIIIDGIEVQLKATDSVGYINSVDNQIQVITTTEVADLTDAIDSGISNTEISETTTDALGGTIIDGTDAVVNTILGSLGGLGLFASLRGFNHTMKRIDQKTDVEEAILEGAEIVIVGTAKGGVDTLEFVFKLITSNPVTFIGKVLWGTVKFFIHVIIWFTPLRRN